MFKKYEISVAIFLDANRRLHVLGMTVEANIQYSSAIRTTQYLDALDINATFVPSQTSNFIVIWSQ